MKAPTMRQRRIAHLRLGLMLVVLVPVMSATMSGCAVVAVSAAVVGAGITVASTAVSAGVAVGKGVVHVGGAVLGSGDEKTDK